MEQHGDVGGDGPQLETRLGHAGAHLGVVLEPKPPEHLGCKLLPVGGDDLRAGLGNALRDHRLRRPEQVECPLGLAAAADELDFLPDAVRVVSPVDLV